MAHPRSRSSFTPLPLTLVAVILACGGAPPSEDSGDLVLSAGEETEGSSESESTSESEGSGVTTDDDSTTATTTTTSGDSTGDTGDTGDTDDTGDTGDTDGDTGDACSPGATEACYSGPPATLGEGPCVAGLRACDDDGLWGPCLGEVLPSNELCANGIDDNCDGVIDEDPDADGDGYTVCGGDCCDVAGGTCIKPELVNPGAYEVADNGVDDDCDGVIDEATPTCDPNLASDSAAGLDYARALDLCQFTVENPETPEEKIWGVISADFSLADGKGQPKAVQRAIRPGFGDVIKAPGGERLAILSSGHAAAVNDQAPAYASFQSGTNLGTQSPPPADWFAANDGVLPNPPGCLSPGEVTSNDPIMLTLRVRAPTNARSFSLDMFFFSAEYPEWVCSQYNDFFVALLDSTAPQNPADKNIAIYADGDESWPVGVNLAKVADGLFTACANGTVGCADKGIPESNYSGCVNTNLLKGTGFDAIDNSGCGAGDPVGGGTGWLTMTGNVTPGEIFELRLAIWDSGGHIFDSLVLLDRWRWSLDAAEPGLMPQ